jgi:hypothetical protein
MSPPGWEVGLSDLVDDCRWSHRLIICGHTGSMHRNGFESR